MDGQIIETSILALFIGLGQLINVIRGKKADNSRKRQTQEIHASTLQINETLAEKFDEHARTDQTNFSQIGAAIAVVGTKIESIDKRLARLEDFQDHATFPSLPVR